MMYKLNQCHIGICNLSDIYSVFSAFILYGNLWASLTVQ